MPKYLYFCKKCEQIFETFHSIHEDLEQCEICEEKECLERRPYSSLSVFTVGIKSKKPGDLVKNFIESSRDELNKEKNSAKKKDFKK